MRISSEATSSLLKALSDPTRLRIVNLLTEAKLCVCSIEQVLGISQTAASRHLARLQAVGILSSERRAQWVYYSIDQRFSRDHAPLLQYLRTAAQSDLQLVEDQRRLQRHASDETLCMPTLGN